MQVLRSKRIIGAIGLLALATVVGTYFYTASQPEEVKTVRAAHSAPSDLFQTEIYLTALRELGYEVQPTLLLSPAEFYPAVAAGEVDFWASGVFERDIAHFAGTNNAAQRIGYVAEAKGLRGYMIDKRTAEAHGITNLADFKDPEIASLFDTTGDGKADLIGCEPDGDCDGIINHHVSSNDLSDSIDVISGVYAQAVSEVVSRHKSGESVFFYVEMPSWVIGELVAGEDVIWLEAPSNTLPQSVGFNSGKVDPIEGVTGCANDPCLLGFPTNDIRVVASRDFIRDNIAARQIFEIMAISPEDISAQNARMMAGEDSAADVTRHVQEWISANQVLFDNWVAQGTGNIREELKSRGKFRNH